MGPGNIVEVTPIGFGDRVGLKAEPSVFDKIGPGQDILSLLLNSQGKFRLGGGLVILIVDESGEVSVVGPFRDSSAPRSPSSVDIAAGMSEAMLGETEFDPRIPQAVRLLGEGQEVILAQKDSTTGRITFLLPNFWNSSFSTDQRKFLWSQYLNTIGFIVTENKIQDFTITTHNSEIARFDSRDSRVITLVENFGGSKYTSPGVAYTFEANERSIELIWPLVLHVGSGEKMPFDGTYFDGEGTATGYYDTGVIGNLLNRNIMVLHSDGTVDVYNRGKVLFRRVTVEEFIKTNVAPLIVKGSTTGATSKVFELAKLAREGVQIEGTNKKYPLSAYKEYVDALRKFLPEKRQ